MATEATTVGSSRASPSGVETARDEGAERSAGAARADAASLIPGAIAGAAVGALAAAYRGSSARDALATSAAGAITGAFASNVVAEIRRRWGVSQRTLARMIGSSERSIQAWESGSKPLTTERRARLHQIDRLHGALSRIMRSDSLARWLDEPVPAFGGATPLQVIERGEMDRIWEMIYDVRAGEPS